MNKTDETADEHLASQLTMTRDMGRKGHHALNGIVARNALHEELGRFKDGHLPIYDPDQATRDRLLAHARQDAAHALCNTASLLDEVKTLRRMLIALIGLLVVGALLFVGLLAALLN